MNEQGNEEQVQADESQNNDIDSLLNEFSDVFEAQPAAQVQETEPQAQQTEEPVSEEQAATPAEEKPQETALSSVLAAKSREEREFRQKLEQAKSSAEKAAEQARAELLAELKKNPQAFLAKHELDPEQIALHAYAAYLGDDAPAELKQQIGSTDLDRYKAEVEAKFAKLEQERLVAEQRARDEATLSQYRGLLNSVPSEMKFFAAEAAHDADGALRAMAEVADHIYGTTGEYPSATEVAAMIDNQIKETAARYAALNQTPGTAQAESQPKETPKTVSKSTKSITLSNEDRGGSAAAELPVGEDALFEDALSFLNDMIDNSGGGLR